MENMDDVRISPVGRSLADATGLAQRGEFDQTPPADDALKAMAVQLRGMKVTINTLYLVTTVGAFLILAQQPLSDVALGLEWFKLPLALLSKQALAVILSGAFAYYAAALVSFTLLYGTMMSIVKRRAEEGWEYLLSPYFADVLWMTVLRPKKLGYPTRFPEKVVAFLVYATNFAVVGAHSVLVAGATAIAAYAAWTAGNVFGEILGGLALVSVVSAFGGMVAALFLRFTYKSPEQGV